MQKTTARDSIIRVALTAGKGGSRKTERWLSMPGLGALKRRNIHDMVKAQQEVQFADVTPERPSSVSGVAVTVRITGAEADIHNGADAATVEMALRVLKSC